MNCPLCLSSDTFDFYHKKQHVYYHCKHCYLNFLDPQFHLNRHEEKKLYDNHENIVDDPNYRKFLSQLFIPLSKYLKSGSKGLDFGCGNGPALAKMLEEAGHKMALYDLYYYPDKSVLNQHYDFIVSSEVFEHLYQAREILDELWTCLKPSGLFGIMTQQYEDLEKFKNWYYINDPSHVIFFHQETFIWLSKKWNAKFEMLTDKVVIFRKN